MSPNQTFRAMGLAVLLFLSACTHVTREADMKPVQIDLATVRNLVTVSDSLTNDEPTNHIALLGKELGKPVYAEAHGGWSTTSYFRERLAAEAFARVPKDADVCIILIGSNNLFEDAGGSEWSVKEAVIGVERIAAHMEKLAPGVRFVLVAPPTVSLSRNKIETPKPQRRIDVHTPAILGQLSVAYRDLAARRGWPFVDLYPLLTDDDFIDAAHLSPAGNAKIARAIRGVFR